MAGVMKMKTALNPDKWKCRVQKISSVWQKWGSRCVARVGQEQGTACGQMSGRLGWFAGNLLFPTLQKISDTFVSTYIISSNAHSHNKALEWCMKYVLVKFRSGFRKLGLTCLVLDQQAKDPDHRFVKVALYLNQWLFTSKQYLRLRVKIDRLESLRRVGDGDMWCCREAGIKAPTNAEMQKIQIQI